MSSRFTNRFRSLSSRFTNRFRSLLQTVEKRFPILQKLLGVGWKVALTEVLIEIPFLILESSFLMRFLFGVTLGLTFWQYIVIAATLYLTIELGRWAFSRFIRKFQRLSLLEARTRSITNPTGLAQTASEHSKA